MADFFIKRPILSICLSVIIVLLGAFSILRLPISEYPDIIPPSIQVTATYPGADCETVVKSIASPIEQQMSGVDVGSQRAGSLPPQDKRAARPGRQPLFPPGDL